MFTDPVAESIRRLGSDAAALVRRENQAERFVHGSELVGVEPPGPAKPSRSTLSPFDEGRPLRQCSTRRPAASMARRASSSSTSPGRPLTPTAPTRSPVEGRDAALEEREERVEARPLDRVVGDLHRERRGRGRVGARRRVGLPLRVQARVRSGPVHRRRGDQLAGHVRDEHGHGPTGLANHEVDDRLGLIQLHEPILTARRSRRLWKKCSTLVTPLVPGTGCGQRPGAGGSGRGSEVP